VRSVNRGTAGPDVPVLDNSEMPVMREDAFHVGEKPLPDGSEYVRAYP
jgi:hypothetical protein